MTELLLRNLILATAALSLATLLVMMLRTAVRRFAGAERAYLLWLTVPLAPLTLFWPKTPDVIVLAPMVHASAPTAIAPVLAATTTAPSSAIEWITLWLLGAFTYALLLGVRQARYARRLRPTADGVWRSNEGAGPALIGTLRPRLVLPEDFEQRYDAQERELILRHENAHRERGDAQVNTFVACLRVLQWFNPLVHIAQRLLRHDQELACDARIMRQTPQAARAYANAMLKTQMARQELPLGCQWQIRHPLVQRIAQLSRTPPSRAARWFGSVMIGLAGAGVSVIVHAVQPAPQAVASTRASMPTIGKAMVVDMRLSIDGRSSDSFAVITEDDGSFELHDNLGTHEWNARLRAQAQTDGRVRIHGSIEEGIPPKLISAPDLKVALRQSSRIHVTTKDGASEFKLDLTVRPYDGVLPEPIAPKAEVAAQPAIAALAPVAEPATEVSVAAVPARAPRAESATPVPAAVPTVESQGAQPAVAAEPARFPEPRIEVGDLRPAMLPVPDGAPVTTERPEPSPRPSAEARPGTAAPTAPTPQPGAPIASSPPARSVGTPAPSRPTPATPVALPAPPGSAAPRGITPVGYGRMMPPDYSNWLVQAHAQADMTLSVHVDASGSPTEVQVERALVTARSDDDVAQATAEFRALATDAVKRWHFDPARGADGKAIDAWVGVPIQFWLH